MAIQMLGTFLILTEPTCKHDMFLLKMVLQYHDALYKTNIGRHFFQPLWDSCASWSQPRMRIVKICHPSYWKYMQIGIYLRCSHNYKWRQWIMYCSSQGRIYQRRQNQTYFIEVLLHTRTLAKLRDWCQTNTLQW